MTDIKFENIASLINAEEIAKDVAAKLKQEVANTVYYTINDTVRKEVEEILKENVKEIVRAQSQTILDAVTKAMPEVAQALCVGIVEKAVRNLGEKSYNRDSIITSIFK